MIWIIYLLSAGTAVFLVYGFSQLKLERIEDDDREREAATLLFNTFKPLIEQLASYNQKMNYARYEEKIQKKLIISGNRLNLIPAEFLAIKQISAITGTLFALFLVLYIDAQLMNLLIFGIGAFFLPDLVLRQTVANRKKEIFLELPFCMDLLALSMEAGMGFTMAIEQVVEKGGRGSLNSEFGRLLRDIRLGVTMREALTGLAARTDMFELRSFTSALIQADMLGAPLAEVLQTQSDIRRSERFQKAEKLAHEAPVKILFPLLFFIFPAVFIILLVPIFLKFMAEGM